MDFEVTYLSSNIDVGISSQESHSKPNPRRLFSPPSPTPPRTLLSVLKENLTCEMYQATLNLFSSSYHFIVKLHLFTFLLVSYALASYTTISLMMSFFDYGVISKTTVVHERPVEFPKITLCNMNPFTTEYSLNVLTQVNKLLYPNVDLLNGQLDEVGTNITKDFYDNLVRATMGFVANFSDVNKKRLSHSLDDIMLTCLYNQRVCSPSTDFSWSFDPFYGNCYSFNADLNQLKTASMEGSAFGLDLTMYVNFYGKRGSGLSLLNSASQGMGLIIRVDNRSHVVDYLADGMRVPAGQRTFLSVSREFRESLPKPYSNCELDKSNTKGSDGERTLYDIVKSSTYDYTQMFCLRQCIQRLSIQMCNCSFPLLVSLFDTAKCVDLACPMSRYYIDFDEKFIQTKCLPECPLECNSAKFNFQLTGDTLIGDYFQASIKSKPNLYSDFIVDNRTLDAETARQSIVKLFVYYESLSYAFAEQSPQIDFVTLLASIGGNLGLFLGVSLFSLCEMITCIIEVYFFQRDKNKKSKVSSQVS